MTVQCCVCKMVKVDDDWEFDGHGGRADASHTYCPRCLKAATNNMRIERVQADMSRPVGA